jgi:hypothetical protein
VLLVLRNPTVSPFACLVLCSYPVIEALYSIWRRVKNKKSSGNPDRQHLHQLIGEKLIYPALGKSRSTRAKSATTGFAVSLFCVPTTVMAYAIYDQQNTLIILFCGLSLGYWLVYRTASNMNARQGIRAKPIIEVIAKPRVEQGGRSCKE